MDNEELGLVLDTFLRIVRLPGVIGGMSLVYGDPCWSIFLCLERCFKYFDVYQKGYLTFSDFKEGLALFCKQGEIARRRIIFQIFDTNKYAKIFGIWWIVVIRSHEKSFDWSTATCPLRSSLQWSVAALKRMEQMFEVSFRFFFCNNYSFYRLARSQYQIRFSCMFSIDFNSIL